MRSRAYAYAYALKKGKEEGKGINVLYPLPYGPVSLGPFPSYRLPITLLLSHSNLSLHSLTPISLHPNLKPNPRSSQSNFTILSLSLSLSLSISIHPPSSSYPSYVGCHAVRLNAKGIPHLNGRKDTAMQGKGRRNTERQQKGSSNRDVGKG